MFASLTFYSKEDAELTRETFASTLPRARSVSILLAVSSATLRFETKALTSPLRRPLSLHTSRSGACGTRQVINSLLQLICLLTY